MFKFNDISYSILELQNALGGLVADGHLGTKSETKIKEYQKANGMTVNGIADKALFDKLGIYLPTTKELSDDDYIYASKVLGCEIASIKAVVEVESKGSGFLNGDVKILFEPHVFWRELKSVGINPNNHTKGNSDILYQNWKTGDYGTYNIQWSKMKRAIAINKVSALKSASYGKFQVMGFNHLTCGYPNVNMFVNDMQRSEYYHLIGFINFCKNTKSKGQTLAYWLKNKNWANFAYGYNGSGYAKNQYDNKMANAYKKYAK